MTKKLQSLKNEIPPFQLVINLRIKNHFTLKIFCIIYSNTNLIKI